MQSWTSNGKLLLTGEYLVLSGALSLALPLKLQQSLCVSKSNKKTIKWQAKTHEGDWFTAEYNSAALNLLETDNVELANRLKDILLSTASLSLSFINENIGRTILTNLDFNPEFGFGTSSTLISNIASWAKVDPYELLDLTFGGSGYDIACAKSNNPILFQRHHGEINVKEASFYPDFEKNLYFVYLGKKQNSARSIKNFKAKAKFNACDIDTISSISKMMCDVKKIEDFERLIDEHELLMSSILNIPVASSLYFNNTERAVKSLGAWGGDFVLVTSKEPELVFKKRMLDKGFDTVFNYKGIVRKREK
jgi:mevalonate kinase